MAVAPRVVANHVSAPDIYEVFCIAVGEKNPFLVEIGKDETVGDLKELIMETRSDVFAGIAANLVYLYHVDLADDDNFVANVNEELRRQPARLRATEEIADIFGGTPKEEAIHIIVQPPRIGT